MDAAPDKSAVATPPASEVAEDRPCRQCGYNLRGLRTDGACPECATPIAMSIREPLLRYSPPAYVGKLRRGARLIAFGLTIVYWTIVVFLVLFVLMLINASVAGTLAFVLAIPLILASPLMVVSLLLGAWFFTAPAPTVFAAQPEDRAARVARAALAIGLCGIVLSRTVPALSPPMQLMALLEVALVAFGIVGTIGIHAHFRHVGEIARRIPDNALTMDARNLAYVTTLVLAILLGLRAIHVAVTWLPALMSGPAPTSGPAAATGLQGTISSAFNTVNTCAIPILVLVLLAQASKAITVHKRLRPLLDREWRAAEEFWEKETPAGEEASPTVED